MGPHLERKPEQEGRVTELGWGGGHLEVPVHRRTVRRYNRTDRGHQEELTKAEPDKGLASQIL